MDAFEEQDISRRFVKVFDQWKKEQKVPYTWNTIIAALEAAGEIKVAKDIRKWLSASFCLEFLLGLPKNKTLLEVSIPSFGLQLMPFCIILFT